MRQLLTHRFGFSEGDIVTLSEDAGSERHLPTRENIERELRRLGQVAGKGDQVVILLAGHGSQQPDDDPDNPDDSEPDGLDEIFLPRDVTGWDGTKGRVDKAICDDELRNWLGQIRRKGAFVWAIVDACHSGTMVRGAPAESVRQLQYRSLGVPTKLVRAARQKALATRARASDGANFETLDISERVEGAIIAIYAAQSTEPTVETSLPPDSDDPKPYGLLSYTLNSVLNRTANPLTYRELVQRVHQQYIEWNRSYPTPLLEGTDIDREVLGKKAWKGRSSIILERTPTGQLRINVGSLHGITRGSVLAVSPPADSPQPDLILGHVKVTEVEPLDCTVSPVPYGDRLKRDDLPANGKCDLVFRDFGDLQLRVAVTGDDPDRVMPAVRNLASEPGSLVRVVEDRKQADWLIHVEGPDTYLAPASGWLIREADHGGERIVPRSRLGPAPKDASLRGWLGQSLEKIARARNLLSLAASETGSALFGLDGIDIHLEMLRSTGNPNTPWQIVDWDNGRQVRPDDRVVFRVHNRGRESVDVSFLFIDANYGIEAVFPKPGFPADNRIEPGKSISTRPARVTPAAAPEHMIVIAIRSDVSAGERIDFSCLAQPSITQARASVERERGASGAARTLDSPLGQLLQNALFGEGTTRGLDTTSLSEHALRVLSWRTRATKPPPEVELEEMN
jgi:hypothetical protein